MLIEVDVAGARPSSKTTSTTQSQINSPPRGPTCKFFLKTVFLLGHSIFLVYYFVKNNMFFFSKHMFETKWYLRYVSQGMDDANG